MPLTPLRDLVDDAEARWGDPNENIGRIVPFGVMPVDQATIGIPVDRGGFFLLQGVPGTRKTTVALNFLLNQLLSGRLPQGYHIAYDTLESGMTIERIADILWAMVATKYLVYWHWNNTDERDILRLLSMGLPDDIPPSRLVEEVVGQGRRETILRPEFFQFSTRSPRQQAAIEMARAVIRNFPLFVFGISEHPVPAVALARTTATWDLAESKVRWAWMFEHYNMRELVVDHMQEYQFHDSPIDFEIQKRVVPMLAGWQKASHGIVWLISQIGVTSEREARREGINPYSQGGKVAEAESSATWTVDYNQDDPYHIKFRRPNKSRIGMHPDVAIPIDPFSGAFIGKAVKWNERMV
ncbi:MAG: hypothetical protein A2W25_12085 [candidate division Zixibacteria bacterium RBG_16_53_22]|nr:MAG: hypothetical protein A2W25_12085 [candidate division Zixibacteria bacterium RBG_16_53_22]